MNGVTGSSLTIVVLVALFDAACLVSSFGGIAVMS